MQIIDYVKHFIMNKFLSTVAIAIGLIATTSVRAQQADIYPKPQNIAWESEIAFANNTSYTLDGEGDAFEGVPCGNHR